MSQIGTLTTGVGVVSTINLQYVPQYIVIGSAFNAADVAVSAISWSISGAEKVNISGITYLNSYAKYKNQGDLSNSLVNQIFMVGFGYMQNKQFQLRITNNAAATPAVYAFARTKNGSGRVLTAAQQVVVDGANQRFQNFLALHFDPTNLDKMDATFKNAKTGETYTETFLPEEVQALFGLDNISEGGLLSTVAVVDNINLLNRSGVYIESVNIFANGANITVLVEGVSQM